ncbi:MAG: HAD-IIIA family hydrolase [Nostoc sp. DedQUE04]|uniref:HAD-IIIA family hydrolase n=1 Tax=Nostoc sp. DedQUE04 TaxID=3075390 RepID=UPI002AD48826|nr:HAD-IIIA family hydrolase [Nostoc sp. DedQUE04]MDZ8138999.1 HAD-IIIA family hydrolase [Nostoc sp. DedQUE04]
MYKGLFLDLDGTVRESTDGKFIQQPTGQRIMAGVHEAIAHHKRQNYTIIGITNQGGCDTINRDTGKPLKSLEDAITEQKYTLKLIPQLEAIYFCPDMKGQVCWIVKKNGFEFLVSDLDTRISEFENRILTGSEVYRKPGAGMIYRAVKDFDIDLTKSWMIGDRDEDEKAAITAGVNFMWADIWHTRFTPGMCEVRQATPQQVEFLEGINLN